MKRRFASLLLLSATIGLAVSLAPLAGSAQAGSHVLRYADGTDVSSLNPFLATSGNSVPLQELTAAEFFRFDAHGNAIPDLVTEVPTKANHGISADGKTITFHLRKNVKWSDGAPFDASDVVFSYRVALDPSNNLANRDPWTRLLAVDAKDPYTVVFRFKAPYALFLQDYFSTQSNAAILPKHVIGPGTSINQAPYNNLPVGIGPFRFSAYRRGDAVEMEANPYYWRGKPKLAKVIYKLVTDANTALTQVQTGELDLFDLINGVLAQRAKTLPGKMTATRLSNYESALFFNVTHPSVRDAAVRRALSFATNRNAILEKVILGNGVPSQSLIPLTVVDAIHLPFDAFDLAKAATLLDAAGWKPGPGGVREKGGTSLTIDMVLPSGYPVSAAIANILHDDWGKVGANVTIRTVNTSQFFAVYANGGTIQTSKFDVALFSQSIGPIYANIGGVYDCAGVPPNGQNATRYCNHTVDALYDRYVKEFDPAKRHAIAAQFQQIMNDDRPAITLYDRTFLAAYDAKLTGYHPNSYSYWGDPMELDI
jgi:peptide/nickel transport system substrate-binding protein